MDRWLGPWRDTCYALLRIVAALLYVCHGTQKLFGVPGGRAVAGTTLMQAAGVIELVAGSLLVVGLFTTYAAFLASGEMAVAYFISHARGGFWPILNRGELAVLFCFLFLYIASRGSGPLSLDQWRYGLRRKKQWPAGDLIEFQPRARKRDHEVKK